MNYTSITAEQRAEMLSTIGVSSIDELFEVIPEKGRFRGELDLPAGASELELQRELGELTALNRGSHNSACFMGGGAYDHFVPTLVDQLILRGEFLTAYTPYQAEASQGSLQAFFEFQTQVTRITGMEIANASLYEGASATAEGVYLALNTTGKRRVLVSSTLHPDHRAVLETGLADLPAELVEVPAVSGRMEPDAVRELADNDTACVVAQSPNFFGQIEDWEAIFSAVREKSTSGKAPLGIAVFNPIACALLRTPGECGADVAAGEGQPLGIPLQFGGPYLGLFAAKREHLRRMPGRLIGQTEDSEGRRAYTLVLQTREQHIRGAKATSNICTNQGLLALRATMHVSAMGQDGLREVAEQCWHKAHYLAERIGGLPGYSLRHAGEFFNEFVVRCPGPASEIVEAGRKAGIMAGVALGTARVGGMGAENELMIAVTEKRTRAEMDRLVTLLESCAE